MLVEMATLSLNSSFRDALLGAGPESTITIVSTESGLATSSRPGMTEEGS